jgi:hypothetical protein
MERRTDALPLIGRALRESLPTAFSRSAAAAIAGLVLPHAAMRTLRRLPV